MSVVLNESQIEDLLVYCGSSITRWKSHEMTVCCPVHGESHPSMGVNSELQCFNCFACGAHGNLAKMLYLSKPDEFGYDSSTKETQSRTRISAEIKAWNFLAERYELEFSSTGKKSHSIRRFEEARKPTIKLREEQPLWKIASYHSGLATYNYFFKRGFTKEDMKNFMIGYDDVNETITIPVFYEDEVLAGVIGRYINPNRLKNQRYKIYDNFNRGSTLFPLNKYHTEDGSMILVEGQFDAIRMHALGYSNTLSIMSDNITREQKDLILKLCNKIIYIGDNDVRGLEARDKNKELFRGLLPFYYVDFPAHGKDVCDWSAEEIEETVNSAHSLANKVRRI